MSPMRGVFVAFVAVVAAPTCANAMSLASLQQEAALLSDADLLEQRADADIVLSTNPIVALGKLAVNLVGGLTSGATASTASTSSAAAAAGSARRDHALVAHTTETATGTSRNSVSQSQSAAALSIIEQNLLHVSLLKDLTRSEQRDVCAAVAGRAGGKRLGITDCMDVVENAMPSHSSASKVMETCSWLTQLVTVTAGAGTTEDVAAGACGLFAEVSTSSAFVGECGGNLYLMLMGMRAFEFNKS